MPAKQNHPVVCYGEALWTVLPTGKQLGGSTVRITCHLQQLGMNPAVVSRIGYDELGREMIETLEAGHICTDYFQMDEDKLTGFASAYMKEGYETVYTIYNDAAWDGIEFTKELSELASDAGYFVYDSVAARSSESRQTLMRLLTVANTKVLHMHLCSPFYNRHLIEELLMQADIAILTGAELELITGWFSNYKEIADRMLALQEKCRIPMIGIIDGKEGFGLAVNSILYTRKRFGAQVKKAGISNDAFTAGLLAKLSDGASYEDTLQYASAAAVIGFNSQGVLPVYDKKEIDDWLYAGQ